jgi:hypothetical protein
MATPRHDRTQVDLMTLSAGLRKHAAGKAFVLDQTRYSVAQIVKRIDALVASCEDVFQKRARLAQAIAKDRKLRAAEAQFLALLRSHLTVIYSSATLAEMGLRRRKPRRAATVAELAARNEKTLATRKARHTMGRRQKAKVKGAVPKPTNSE